MNWLLALLGKDWVGSIIGLIGLIIGSLGIYLYLRSKHAPKPAVQMSSIRLLGHGDDTLPDEVAIAFRGKIVERLTKTTVVLWNSGSDILDGDQIVGVDPIKFSFSEGDRILRWGIVKRTKSVNSVHVAKLANEPQSVKVSLDYMDPGDGATVELFHDSKKRYPKVIGSIKGVPKGIVNYGRIGAALRPSKRDPLARNTFLGLALFFGLSMMTVGLLPQEVRETFGSILYRNNPSKEVSNSWFWFIGGAIYAALPASILWIRRRRFPKILDPGDTDS